MLIPILLIAAVLCIVYCIVAFFIGWGGGTFSFLVALALVATSFGLRETQQENSYEKRSVEEACQTENARDVPAPATVSSVKDNRVGPIYPCYYLLDHGVVAGVEGHVEAKPMALRGGVTEQLFSDQEFHAQGDIGGFLLFGTGAVSGNYTADQTVRRTQAAAFVAETERGYTSFLVESGAVRYQECSESCTPSVRIWTSPEPLFTKKLDDQKNYSIWGDRMNHPRLASLTRGGTPASPGQTLQALATRIDVTMPREMIPG